jgi:hypothetical protein
MSDQIFHIGDWFSLDGGDDVAAVGMILPSYRQDFLAAAQASFGSRGVLSHADDQRALSASR